MLTWKEQKASKGSEGQFGGAEQTGRPVQTAFQKACHIEVIVK